MREPYRGNSKEHTSLKFEVSVINHTGLLKFRGVENELNSPFSLVPRELLLHRLVEVIAPRRGLLAVEQLLAQHLRAKRKKFEFGAIGGFDI